MAKGPLRKVWLGDKASGKVLYIGEYRGKTFRAACYRWAKGNNRNLFDHKRVSYGGYKFYDNEGMKE